MFKKIIGTILLLLVITLSACGDKLPIETDMSEDVADFSFTNQHDETVKLDDLSGKWWLADFVFTNCKTVCLPMTSNMSKLQDDLSKEDISIQFVSFSVDPEYDQPEVLKTYGEEYGASFENWDFLTGYDFQTARELSIKSFRAPLKEPSYGDDQVTHDTRFFLVDPEGNVVKGYDGVNSESMQEIIDDLLVLDEKGFM